MGREFATRNLIHEKIPEFPGGSDADIFLTKSEIMQQASLVNVIDSRDNEIPIMDNVVKSSITFTADLMNVRLPQDTSGILITIVSQINGQYADWSVESVSDYFNASKRDNNRLVISAKENQTTEYEKRGSVVIVQSASGQKLELSVSHVKRRSLKVMLKQNNIYSAFDTETATPSYTLLSVGIGADIKAFGKKDFFNVFISGENLTDVAYQNHLSRLKYAPENPATGRIGVYNMGRNFSVKLMMNF